jgi:hypothetical protein
MKKIRLFAILIAFVFSACATTTNNTGLVNKSPLSVKRFVATCGTPIESYFIQQLGVRVHRHKNCMGVDDLLSLVWAGGVSQDDLDGISLLAIIYAARLNKIDPDANYLVALLKIDSFTQNDLETNVAFYRIKRKIINETPI